MSATFFDPTRSERASDEVDRIRDLAALTTPTLRTEMLTVRAKLMTRMDALPTADLRYRAERLRLIRERLVRDYLSGINAIRELAERDDIKRLQTTLQQRLAVGCQKQASPTRDALWSRLLAEYEIVTDCLSENALWRWQDRLIEVEARWR